MYTIVPTQVDGGAAKKGTAQLFKLANSARIFIRLSWYYMCTTIITHLLSHLILLNTMHLNSPTII